MGFCRDEYEWLEPIGWSQREGLWAVSHEGILLKANPARPMEDSNGPIMQNCSCRCCASACFGDRLLAGGGTQRSRTKVVRRGDMVGRIKTTGITSADGMTHSTTSEGPTAATRASGPTPRPTGETAYRSTNMLSAKPGEFVVEIKGSMSTTHTLDRILGAIRTSGMPKSTTITPAIYLARGLST